MKHEWPQNLTVQANVVIVVSNTYGPENTGAHGRNSDMDAASMCSLQRAQLVLLGLKFTMEIVAAVVVALFITLGR